MGANIIICTLLMWVLTAIAVVPLANRFFLNALAGRKELALAGGPVKMTKELVEQNQKLYNYKFIQADVIVLGIAGFLAGVAGYPLIGIALKANAWPGLLALIGTSFLGAYLTGSTRVF